MILFDRNRISFFAGILLSVATILLLTGQSAFSQQPDAVLEQRVTALENYVDAFQPTLIELSDELNKSILQYTKDLEDSLEKYSLQLESNLDQRFEERGRKTVVLNPFSRGHQSIETNVGVFIIAVEKVESIEEGYRLHLNVGNPNFADYQSFKLKFIWGKEWIGGIGISYDQWRQSLTGVEFTFKGKIEKGKWNAFTVDLAPVETDQFSYLECEMTVSSVELKYN